ncbi:MAG: hypothetical protein JNM93_07745 [Bacteriovoracaceae bacterium]|nr:hypothetical protein [Bacteriovoracaceae bacterium]
MFKFNFILLLIILFSFINSNNVAAQDIDTEAYVQKMSSKDKQDIEKIINDFKSRNQQLSSDYNDAKNNRYPMKIDFNSDAKIDGYKNDLMAVLHSADADYLLHLVIGNTCYDITSNTISLVPGGEDYWRKKKILTSSNDESFINSHMRKFAPGTSEVNQAYKYLESDHGLGIVNQKIILTFPGMEGNGNPTWYSDARFRGPIYNLVGYKQEVIPGELILDAKLFGYEPPAAPVSNQPPKDILRFEEIDADGSDEKVDNATKIDDSEIAGLIQGLKESHKANPNARIVGFSCVASASGIPTTYMGAGKKSTVHQLKNNIILSKDRAEECFKVVQNNILPALKKDIPEILNSPNISVQKLDNKMSKIDYLKSLEKKILDSKEREKLPLEVHLNYQGANGDGTSGPYHYRCLQKEYYEANPENCPKKDKIMDGRVINDPELLTTRNGQVSPRQAHIDTCKTSWNAGCLDMYKYIHLTAIYVENLVQPGQPTGGVPDVAVVPLEFKQKFKYACTDYIYAMMGKDKELSTKRPKPPGKIKISKPIKKSYHPNCVVCPEAPAWQQVRKALSPACWKL